MKKFRYSCDGGSLLLGNENFTCCYMNDYGDGTHNVYIKTREEKWPKLPYDISFYDMYHFEGSVKGNFNVYNYDCLSKTELTNKENIICALHGRYGIYSVKHTGDMVLECWED